MGKVDAALPMWLFQSRNRDAFQFREELDDYLITTDDLFQSRNRDAFHFRAVPAEPLTRLG